ncbi:hypothetical protein PoB_005902400 [Plakobranchus ocellatus]|uniref:Uncharacterized protein n=1 Tax=Plakobranchus ocellatus TaxID=259542 RepID=A0AAV4CMT3_9GAST|nr:hypothetical protein PoB_005902400 [Plakobranchus ocellatus]
MASQQQSDLRLSGPPSDQGFGEQKGICIFQSGFTIHSATDAFSRWTEIILVAEIVLAISLSVIWKRKPLPQIEDRYTGKCRDDRVQINQRIVLYEIISEELKSRVGQAKDK